MRTGTPSRPTTYPESILRSANIFLTLKNLIASTPTQNLLSPSLSIDARHRSTCSRTVFMRADANGRTDQLRLHLLAFTKPRFLKAPTAERRDSYSCAGL